MICPKCGQIIADNVQFCTSCGSSLKEYMDILSGGAKQQPAQQPVQQYQQPAQQYQQPVQQYQQPVQQYQQPVQQYQQPVQQYQQAPQYPQQPPIPAYRMPPSMPVAQLKTDRSLLITILLSAVTLGIYRIVTYTGIVDDVNTVCSRYDGKKSMHYCLVIFLLTPFTLGIGTIVWMHNLCERMGNELHRRSIMYDFGTKDFWLWGVLGSLIIVGPIIFSVKLFTASNKLNESFNMYG